MSIFWHKKKISEFSVIDSIVLWSVQALYIQVEWLAPAASRISSLFLEAFIHLVLTLVSSGPSKKPFSGKEKKLGDGETSQGIEDAPFQHSSLGKPIVRPAAGSLLNKRWGLPFLITIVKDEKWGRALTF